MMDIRRGDIFSSAVVKPTLDMVDRVIAADQLSSYRMTL